jgi:hypothetical protein
MTRARIFIDYRSNILAVPARSGSGTISTNTGIGLVNCGAATANITYSLRNTDGLPIADATRSAPLLIVFPQVVVGGGYSTEIVLLNPVGGSNSTMIFFDEKGAPADSWLIKK